MAPSAPSRDETEIARFAGQAAHWWAPDGPFASLHRMNPARLGVIRDNLCGHFDRDSRQAQPLGALTVADIGCGGGLLSEPLARLGARVTGIDADEEGIGAARAHAAGRDLTVTYEATTAEELADRQPESFDAVCALEIVEHVADRASFLAALARLLKPGGVAVLSTLNRTRRSYWLGIVAAERLLGWLPRGTHDWYRFVTPDELAGGLHTVGLSEVYRCGLVFEPIKASFKADPHDLAVNYMMVATKPA